MRLIIEACIDDGEGEAECDGSTIVATVDRRDKDLAQLGLTLAEGRSLRLGVSHGFAPSLEPVDFFRDMRSLGAEITVVASDASPNGAT